MISAAPDVWTNNWETDHFGNCLSAKPWTLSLSLKSRLRIPGVRRNLRTNVAETDQAEARVKQHQEEPQGLGQQNDAAGRQAADLDAEDQAQGWASEQQVLQTLGILDLVLR